MVVLVLVVVVVVVVVAGVVVSDESYFLCMQYVLHLLELIQLHPEASRPTYWGVLGGGSPPRE